MDNYIVRRLTPTECERLQGFPDDHTNLTGFDPEEILARVPIQDRSIRKAELAVRNWCNECPDAPRYKGCGNSMAVPVVAWVGQRIQMVDDLVREMGER